MRLVHKSASPAATRIRPRPRIGLGAAVGIATALLVTIILSVDLLPRVYEVREGDVAAQTIKASRKQSYISQIRTKQARDTAASLVPPVIELDRDRIVLQTRGLADLLQAISTARGDASRRNPSRPAIRPPAWSHPSSSSIVTASSCRPAAWPTCSRQSALPEAMRHAAIQAIAPRR